MSTMLKEKYGGAVGEVLSALPTQLCREVERLAMGRAEGLSGIREIRLRRDGIGELILGGECLPLSKISGDKMDGIVAKISDGCIFAHRDTIAEGYIAMDFGVRVGIFGSCRYEGGEIVGVGNISGLVFRLPTGRCEFGEQLYSLYSKISPRGALIFSPPGVGKTTALRYLAGALGRGRARRNTVVVDERGEFLQSDYPDSSVSILRGYRKRLGIEIAVRSLSAELVIVDELSADDAFEILSVCRFGVPFIASVHAGSTEEVLKKPSLRPLIETGAVNLLIEIERRGGGYRLTHEILD